ncbi:phosphoadenosine phosphosulfate reductase family protein [Prevotella melaninogenica]|uniref:phosphoadenosine phosphosulfate reductase domain-containing protein n=1 Tax=Prevotella melaninogenica TaxID=28132 RepID=UPI001BADFA04|nr:phosphoadenosine phosphosulfate reductase family protein [Prevotella melaninogenica]QUB63739.1 phosphoadenosine phosphosulfate reductase family protein [Prevotella melaninogenica]
MNKLQEAHNVICRVAEKQSSCIVMCSLGKDSLVTLDLVYPRFERVVCVFMYFVKDLDHINGWIRWVKKKYPKVEFMEVPHWNLTYILRGGLYCVPNPKVKLWNLSKTIEALRLKTNCYYVFLGMKKADGMNRNLMLKGYESNGYENKGLVYPLASWTQKDVLAYMKHKRLPQPVRYSSKAGGGVGFSKETFTWLEKHYLQDLEKIYKVFPMSERILFEQNYKQDNK